MKKILKILLAVLAFILLFFAPHLVHLFERTQRQAVESKAIEKGLERLQKEQAAQSTHSP
ncbi:hypothetical protein EM20IM_09970 [Candidatus Methylacidiphilum infernorum]|uniref:Uncharacterized protein n=1 Tax=Candidatus Methylacidiphilum infernorum TaxID=511746 RepID=A0ABX7PUU8_9BACT|nr:hypothetical protein [Candidatus Methylacidiphilum infernorum]QSR86775.1 hypothetical protein EM20IM_09970 [Candidatus Methylacidiphilum infernorum]